MIQLKSGEQRIDGFLRFLGFRFVRQFHERLECDPAMQGKARARRDDVAHDDVFLEAAQAVNLGTRRGLGQHAGRVLKARGAQEAVGFQRRLGDAEQHGRGFGGLAALFLDRFVFGLEFQLVHLFAPGERGVAGLGDANLAEHLAHDDLDVLVVDGHALEAIHFLHFADQMFLQFLRATDFENLVRVHRAFGELLAFLDEIALEDDDVLADRDEMLLRQLRLWIGDEHAALAAHARTEVRDAVNLGDFRRVFRTTGLEQFRNARQTASDVAGLGLFARRLGDERAGHDPVGFIHDDVRAGRNRIVGYDFALVVRHDDLRMQIFLVVNDDHGFFAGGFVHFLLHGDAFDDVVELHLAGFFGKNRDVVRIPLDERVAFLHLAAILHGNDGADDDGVDFQFAADVVKNGNGTVLVQDNAVAVFQFDGTQFVVFDLAVVLGLDLRLLEHARRHTTGVERAHRELRAGFADGLRGDDANRLAELDERAGSQIAAVAMFADTKLAFASEHRTDADAIHARNVNAPGLFLVNFLVRMNEKFLRASWVDNVVARKAAHETVGDLHHFVFAFEHGGDPDAVRRAAIPFLDDHVLRNVHELAGHITGIGRFERRVGQTFARAVRRDEIFQDGQTFAEVRQNRLLDDFAAGLGHEAAQTGELTHLLLVAARAGIHHQINRVVFFLALVLFERLEHHAGNLIRAMRPHVHDLVVTFAGGDDTLAILFFNFANLLVRVFDLLVAFLRHDHVVNADGHAGLGRLAETNFFELIQHDNGFVVAGKLVAFPNQITEVRLLHRFVVEAEFGGPDFAEQHAADGGLNDLFVGVAKSGLFAEIRIRQPDAVVRFHAVIAVGVNDFFLRAEQRQVARIRRRSLARFSGDVITAERNILRRRDDRLARGRRENIIRRHHQQARFQLRLDGQRNVNSHLIAVEVSVVSSADQRMNADRFAFDELRLERLNGQTMQRGGAGRKDR